MLKLSIKHEFDCSSAAYWKAFFDPAFLRGLYLEQLGFPRAELERLTDPEGDTERTVLIEPRASLPPGVAKLFGGTISYREQGKLDRKHDRYTFKAIPGSLPDKIRNEGVIQIVQHAPERCERLVSLEIEARVFGVGGLIEASIEKTVRSIWEQNVIFLRRFLREQAATKSHEPPP